MSKTGFKIQFSREKKSSKASKALRYFYLCFFFVVVFFFIKFQTLNANTLSQSDFENKKSKIVINLKLIQIKFD